jgi:hypothetical protein
MLPVDREVKTEMPDSVMRDEGCSDSDVKWKRAEASERVKW